ncbi:MAG: AAA family ATPase [Gemmatimonadota bacterium]
MTNASGNGQGHGQGNGHPTGNGNGNGNGHSALISAIVSTDPEFARRLVEMFPPSADVRMALEVAEPFTSITDSHLEALRRLDPDVVFVDLESDPQIGLKFAQFLVDSALGRAIVASGSADSPEILLQAMQAGIQEFLPKPLESNRLSGVIERLQKKAGKSGRTVGNGAEVGKLLSVFSPKGGSGATTFAVNLAVAIHQLTRKRTLIVDLDLELGETALLLGMEPRFSSVDLVRNYHRVDEGLLASYIERDESGTELLSAPYQPADFHSVDGERIGMILGFLKEHYDYIVADAPKTLNPVTMNAFEASDQIYLLCTADLQSLRNVTRSLPLLKGLAGERPDNWIRPIVNRFNPSLPISVGEVERTLGMKVYHTLQNDYRPIMDSINEGRPVVLNKKSKYGEDVRKLAARITGMGPSEDEKGGFFGSLLSGKRGGQVPKDRTTRFTSQLATKGSNR